MAEPLQALPATRALHRTPGGPEISDQPGTQSAGASTGSPRRAWLWWGAAMLAMAALLTWNRIAERKAVDADQQLLLSLGAQSVDQNLSLQLVAIGTALRGVSEDRVNWAAGVETALNGSQRLAALTRAIPGLRTLVMSDRAGRVVAASRPDPIGLPLGGMLYFPPARIAQGGKLLLTPPERTPQGDLAMHLTLVLANPDRAFEGVVSATLDPAYFRGLLHSALYAPDVWAGAAHSSGILLLQEPPQASLVGRNLDVPGSQFARHRASGEQATVSVGRVGTTGDERLVLQRTVRPPELALDDGIVIAVSRTLDGMYAPWHRQTAIYSVLYALIASLSGAGLVATQRRQRALEQMQAQRERAERQGAERLALALRGADLGLWDLDVPSGDAVVSERWSSMLGVRHQSLIPGVASWRDRVHPDDWERVQRAKQRHLDGESPRFDETYRLRHAEGHWVWVLDRAQVLEWDAQGRPVRMVGTHMDVTEVMERQLALRANEQRLQALLDNLRAGVVVHGPDTRILDANPEACRILGLTLDQMRGVQAFDPSWRFLEEDLSVMVPERYPASRVMASRQPLKSLVLAVVRADKERPMWVLVDAYPVHADEGTLEQIVVTFADITERKEAEQRIVSASAALEATLEAVPDLLFEMDLAGCYHDYHSPRLDLLYPAPGGFIGRLVAEVLPAKASEVVLAALRQAHEKGYSTGLQYSLTLPQGTFWFEMSVARKAVPEGEPAHFIVLSRDITARRQAEEELQRMNRSLRVLSSCTLNRPETGDEAAYLQGVCRSVVQVGGYLNAWVGFARHDAARSVQVMATAGRLHAGLEPALVSWDGSVPEGQGPVGTAIRTGQPQIFRRGDADLGIAPWREGADPGIHASAVALPIFLDQRCIGALSVQAGEPEAFDAAEVAPLEELARHLGVAIESLRARQQRDVAEAASRAKSAFLANMSHEIRTPLNAIIGLNYLLRRDGVRPEQAARIDKIDAAGQHLLAIVNDVLDLSKIEAGRVQLESTNFHLASILDSVQSIIAESARAKGLAVEVDGSTVPAWLRGDPTRLRQALLNYAGNAVKFTDRGHIALRAELLGEAGPRVQVRFSVEDSGIGIAAEQIPRLFQAFEQAEAATARRSGGTGLGLSITQRLAQLMGGACGVESRPGVGSTFWFTAWLDRGQGPMLAQPVPDTHHAEALLRERHRGAHVLLAEDNEVNREVALAILHAVELDVDTACDGSEALAMAQERRYDLVLMDMQMPRMDGLAATRAIRRLPGWQRQPVLALTANAFHEDRLACREAGMDDFIGKPMNVEETYQKLLRWLDAGRSTAPKGTGAGA